MWILDLPILIDCPIVLCLNLLLTNMCGYPWISLAWGVELSIYLKSLLAPLYLVIPLNFMTPNTRLRITFKYCVLKIIKMINCLAKTGNLKWAFCFHFRFQSYFSWYWYGTHYFFFLMLQLHCITAVHFKVFKMLNLAMSDLQFHLIYSGWS